MCKTLNFKFREVFNRKENIVTWHLAAFMIY